MNLSGVAAYELYASPTAGATPVLVAVAGADRVEVGEARFAAAARHVVHSAVARPLGGQCVTGKERGPDEAPAACVPLLWRGAPAGALIVDRLLPHKEGLTPGDIELFELLSAHLLPALGAAEARALGTLPRWTVV